MQLTIEPLAQVALGDVVERRCHIIRTNADGTEERKTLWYRVSEQVPLPDDDDCDAYLLACVMYAMERGDDLLVKGTVSTTLLSNLYEFQSVWKNWLPETFSVVDVDCELRSPAGDKAPGAVCAFSGGMDGTFTVWRHSQSLCGPRSQTVRVGVLVHGFDIPLSDEDAFELASNRARQTLSDLGVPLLTIKTNQREVVGVDWSHSHGCGLVAAFNNLKKLGGVCLIGSTDPYNHLRLPWGSSPITDHLLGSDVFEVFHDGSGQNRIEKAEAIADWRVGADNLCVCNSRRMGDENCGHCEKCVRTKCNFLAAGVPIPNCFAASDVVADLKRINPPRRILHAEWEPIHRMAIANQVSGAWVDAVQSMLNRRRVLDSWMPLGSRRRAIADWAKRMARAR